MLKESCLSCPTDGLKGQFIGNWESHLIINQQYILHIQNRQALISVGSTKTLWTLGSFICAFPA